MSMCRCGSCSALIDSDFDLECFVDSKYGDVILCEKCRDHDEYLKDEGERMTALAQDANP